MAINQNHLFEELGGVKCAIVEKNVSPARVEFLRTLLEWNRYTVVVVPSPPPKTAPVAANQAPPAAPAVEQPAPVAPETFTVGVTDLMFNPINAIFGRLLKAPGGHTVTLAYWQQREDAPSDQIPYFESGK
jgi:hypothetical protein